MASLVTLVDVEDDIPIGLWAYEHCPSFTGWLVVNVLNEQMDYRFYFEDERDVTNFIMRWQGQYASV